VQYRTAQRYGWAISAIILACSAQASDYAVEVVDYVPGDLDPNTLDHVIAASALGRPTIDSFDSWGDINPTETVPIVPVFPPYHTNEVVSIGLGGQLVVRFDHPVEDDPRNPYGLDFIVFGNSLQSKGGIWENRDPEGTPLYASTSREPGLVSISQNGTNWFSFTNGPFADSFAPCLGRVYDTENPDTSIGAWNQWWGEPTDPTQPHDPSVSNTHYADMSMSVGGMCRAYRTSAGGTGFDIALFDSLPATSAGGMKWFQYVRIQGETARPEIDALSDVAPLPPYELWRIDHFSWWELADPTLSGDNADPNHSGRPNLLCYAMGRDPRGDDPGGDFTSFVLQAAGQTNFVVVGYTRRRDTSDYKLHIEATTDLVEPAWTTNGIVQEAQVTPLTNGMDAVEAQVPLPTGVEFIRLKAQREMLP